MTERGPPAEALPGAVRRQGAFEILPAGGSTREFDGAHQGVVGAT